MVHRQTNSYTENKINKSFKIEKKLEIMRDWRDSLELEAFADLPKDLSSVPRTHVRQLAMNCL